MTGELILHHSFVYFIEPCEKSCGKFDFGGSLFLLPWKQYGMCIVEWTRESVGRGSGAYMHLCT